MDRSVWAANGPNAKGAAIIDFLQQKRNVFKQNANDSKQYSNRLKQCGII